MKKQTFEEKFPELKYLVLTAETEIPVSIIPIAMVQKHCLSKKRVREAIEKITLKKSPDLIDWALIGMVDPEELLKELNLEEE